MPNRGQIVVFTMFAVALVAATFAWWWNYQRSRHTLDFYGPDAAALIRTAPKVEVVLQGVGEAIDISKSPGLLNARTSLLDGASYDWMTKTIEPPKDSPAVRFSNGERSVTMKFFFEYRAVQASSTGQIARLTKKTADGWKSYIERQTSSAVHPREIKPPEPARTAPSE